MFVAFVSNGTASSIRSESSADIAVVRFTPGNWTETLPPFCTVTVFGSASGVGPSISLSVAVAPTSPLSSETSATTSIGRVESVCGGAWTAATTRSGLSRAIVARLSWTSACLASRT